MTVGHLFTELFHMLEIGSCAVSKKGRAISVIPAFPGVLQISPPKQIMTIVLQQAFTRIVRSGFDWDRDVTIEAEEIIDRFIRTELGNIHGFDPDHVAEAERDLLDVLQGHLQLDNDRATKAKST